MIQKILNYFKNKSIESKCDICDFYNKKCDIFLTEEEMNKFEAYLIKNCHKMTKEYRSGKEPCWLSAHHSIDRRYIIGDIHIYPESVYNYQMQCPAEITINYFSIHNSGKLATEIHNIHKQSAERLKRIEEEKQILKTMKAFNKCKKKLLKTIK